MFPMLVKNVPCERVPPFTIKLAPVFAIVVEPIVSLFPKTSDAPLAMVTVFPAVVMLPSEVAVGVALFLVPVSVSVPELTRTFPVNVLSELESVSVFAPALVNPPSRVAPSPVSWSNTCPIVMAKLLVSMTAPPLFTLAADRP